MRHYFLWGKQPLDLNLYVANCLQYIGITPFFTVGSVVPGDTVIFQDQDVRLLAIRRCSEYEVNKSQEIVAALCSKGQSKIPDMTDNLGFVTLTDDAETQKALDEFDEFAVDKLLMSAPLRPLEVAA